MNINEHPVLMQCACRFCCGCRCRFSPGQNTKCCGKRSAAHVSEVPAILLAVSAKPGKKPTVGRRQRAEHWISTRQNQNYLIIYVWSLEISCWKQHTGFSELETAKCLLCVFVCHGDSAACNNETMRSVWDWNCTNLHLQIENIPLWNLSHGRKNKPDICGKLNWCIGGKYIS